MASSLSPAPKVRTCLLLIPVQGSMMSAEVTLSSQSGGNTRLESGVTTNQEMFAT